MASIQSYPTSYTTSGSISGTNYQKAINKGANTSAVSGNDYASGSSTSKAYIYYSFTFDDLPEEAIISSVECLVKGHAENTSRSTCNVQLYAGNTAKGSASKFTSTSAQTLTLTTGTWTRTEIDDMRLRFEIGYYGGLINGATVTINYTISNPRTITTTLTGNGTINPAGKTIAYDSEIFELTIIPTDINSSIIVTNNSTDVTQNLIAHYNTNDIIQVANSNVTTGFYRSNGAFYQSSSSSSDAWLRYPIGYTAESPYSTTNTNNTYVKDSYNDANTIGWMNYPFDFSLLPEDAEITSIEVKCYGAVEDPSESSSHADIALYSGSNLKSISQSFTSSSNSLITINNPGIWTRAELQDAQLRFTVGYYGGRLLGISWVVNYQIGNTVHHYTYSYTVNGNSTINVTIGNTVSSKKIYIKKNGNWTQYSKVYIKQNGSWVETDPSTIFDTTANYVCGDS